MARWMYLDSELVPVSGPPGPGLVWRGNWNAGTEYQRYHIVHYDGNTYIATEPNVNSEPLIDATPNSDWDIFLQGGTGGGGGTIGDENSVFLKSPDDSVWRIWVDDDGVLTTVEVQE